MIKTIWHIVFGGLEPLLLEVANRKKSCATSPKWPIPTCWANPSTKNSHLLTCINLQKTCLQNIWACQPKQKSDDQESI
jgi:hypothetical protein